MPAGLSHYLLAENVCRELQKESDRQIVESAVLFGAQAPDLMFLYTFLQKSKNNLGVYLHRNNSEEVFRCLCENAKEPAAKSFVYGYLSHYAFDITVHPYVYWLEEKYLEEETREKPSKFHFRIEADLDVFLYEELKGKMDFSFPYADESEPDEKDALEIYLLLKEVFRKVYREDLDYRKYRRCWYNYKRFNRFKSDPYFFKRKFLLTCENLFGLKHTSSMLFQRRNPDERVLNLAHNIWYNPSDGDFKSDEDFYQLFERAKATTLRLIEKFDCGEIDGEFSLHLLFAKHTELFEK